MKLEPEEIRFESFNTNLYLKIRRKREELGLKTYQDYNPDNGLMENHPLKGCKIIDLESGQISIIENVYKHWMRGYYLLLLIYHLTDTGDKSHGTVYWENINSHEHIIRKIIEESRIEYKLI